MSFEHTVRRLNGQIFRLLSNYGFINPRNGGEVAPYVISSYLKQFPAGTVVCSRLDHFRTWLQQGVKS